MRRLSKNRIGKWTVLCLTGCMAAMLGGCGSTINFAENAMSADMAMVEESYTDASQNMGGGYLLEEGVTEDAVTGTTGTEVNESAASTYSERKLIRTVDLNVETKEFDLVMSTLEQQIDVLGGYIEQLDAYNGSSYYGYSKNRNANMTIRIPKDKLDGFLEMVSGISNVINRSEYVEDVTLAYVDIETYRNTLRTEQERLLAFLEQAESIEDIITIEERLSNVRYELESMEAKLRTYDNQVDYSTIYLSITEVQELTPVVEETVWERITGGFVESVQNIGNGIVEFAIWFVINIPYIIIWVIVIVLMILLIKKLQKRRRERKQQKKQVQQDAMQSSNTQQNTSVNSTQDSSEVKNKR